MTRMIFMGSGDKSADRCYDLVRRLVDTFELMAALQQMPGHSYHEISKDEQEIIDEGIRQGWNQVENLADEIYTSLTDRVVTESLPVEWKK